MNLIRLHGRTLAAAMIALAAALSPGLPGIVAAAKVVAVRPTDDAGAGRTWMTYLTQAIPGLVMVKDVAMSKEGFDLSRFDGEEAPVIAPITLDQLEPLAIRANGTEMVAIVSDLSTSAEDGSRGDQISMLSVHKTDGMLVGRVNVTVDRSNGWNYDNPVVSVSPDTDVLALRGSHFNSSQGYDMLMLAFVDGDQIALIDSVLTLSDRLCSRERRQTSRIEAEPTNDKAHGAFRVIVTDEIQPTNEECDGEPAVEASSREIVAHYSWDEAKKNYIADPAGAKALEELADDAQTRF